MSLPVFTFWPGLRRCCLAFLICCVFGSMLFSGCNAERRKSDTELGLNPQQAEGRHIYDQYCARCHSPYSSSGRQGPSLQGVFKKQYLSKSGMPANDDRVHDIIMLGRNKMNGFGNVLAPEQVNRLLAYLHTL